MTTGFGDRPIEEAHQPQKNALRVPSLPVVGVLLFRMPDLLQRKYSPWYVVCFLQGVLAQAKSGEELFSEEKFHAANGKAQTCPRCAFLFVFISFGEDLFHFSLVPNSFKFSIGSHQVPNVFLNMFSIAPHFCPIRFGKCCPPFTYIYGPKGNSICQSITFYFGEPSCILIFSEWWANQIGSFQKIIIVIIKEKTWEKIVCTCFKIEYLSHKVKYAFSIFLVKAQAHSCKASFEIS